MAKRNLEQQLADLKERQRRESIRTVGRSALDDLKTAYGKRRWGTAVAAARVVLDAAQQLDDAGDDDRGDVADLFPNATSGHS